MNRTHSDITLEIDLSAVKYNYELLSKHAKKATCGAVVKANAYGIGVEKVSKMLYLSGCRNFFVATLDEAIELSPMIAPDAQIYVFHGVKPREEDEFEKNGIIPVINDFYQLETWIKRAKSNGLQMPAILHFDTGMNRLGFNWQDAQKVAHNPELKFLDIRYIMSHLACIVEEEHSLNKDQLTRIKEVKKFFPDIPVSISNSKGIIAGEDYHFDMVRPGSALYGIRGSCKTLPLKHVVTAKAKAMQVREVLEDGFVGYGASVPIKKGARIAVCPLGYADGYIRSLSNNSYAFFNGKKVPLLGRVSMDMTIFDVSSIPEFKTGDELELIGENYTVDEIAKNAGTIGYEILTNLGNRYRRVFKG